MTHNSTAITLFWFRRDLRLHDNHGLWEALNGPYPVLPVFIFDKTILESLTDKSDRRVSFIHNALAQIKLELKKNGSSLFCIHNDPLSAINELCKNYNIKQVICNHDYEPYAIQRDERIKNYLEQKSIVFKSYKDQVIFEKNEIVKSDGSAYSIFTPYSKVWKAKYETEDRRFFDSKTLLKKLYKKVDLPFVSLEDLGFKKNETNIPSSQPNIDIIKNYHNTRNIPSLNGSSKLSVHLRFGTLSIRQLVKKAVELNEQWLNELIWREFFMMILYHYPEVVTSSFKRKYDKIKWRNNETEFKHWCEGKTGYPIVDAGMRELSETGFMHNRVRMVVASFLTKHLLIDWRWGEAYFAEKLLDYELSSNNGNWQWAAGCGCDAAPYFRIFNPSEQTKKFDPQLIYIKKWIKDYQPGYITPVVDHIFARGRALQTYKTALNEGE